MLAASGAWDGHAEASQKSQVTYIFSGCHTNNSKFGHVQIPRWSSLGWIFRMLTTCGLHRARTVTNNNLCRELITFLPLVATSNDVGISSACRWLTEGYPPGTMWQLQRLAGGIFSNRRCSHGGWLAAAQTSVSGQEYLLQWLLQPPSLIIHISTTAGQNITNFLRIVI